MPLTPGTSKATIGGNIAEMQGAGYPPAQAQAAALDTARRSGANIPPPKQGRHGAHKPMPPHHARKKHDPKKAAKTAQGYGFG